jgi:hypothetical protein
MGNPITGTLVMDKVTTGHEDSTYPVADQNEIQGGIHYKQTLLQRDAIYAERRTVGMLCHVADDGITYRLEGGILNADWKPFGVAYVPPPPSGTVPAHDHTHLPNLVEVGTVVTGIYSANLKGYNEVPYEAAIDPANPTALTLHVADGNVVVINIGGAPVDVAFPPVATAGQALQLTFYVKQGTYQQALAFYDSAFTATHVEDITVGGFVNPAGGNMCIIIASSVYGFNGGKWMYNQVWTQG